MVRSFKILSLPQALACAAIALLASSATLGGTVAALLS